MDPPTGSRSDEYATGEGPRFNRLQRDLDELVEHARHYAYVRLGHRVYRARRGAVRLMLAAGALVLGSASAVVCLALAAAGAARLLDTAFGAPGWGSVIVGVVGLALLGLAMAVGLAWSERSYRTKVQKDYEQRKREQRNRFGRDVEDLAAATHNGPSRTRGSPGA